jgi:hypothetical protein
MLKAMKYLDDKERNHASHCKRQVQKDSGWIPGTAHCGEAA